MTSLLGEMTPVLGERHPLALELRRELARILTQLGDPQQAWAVLRSLLNDVIAVPGADHPEAGHLRDLLKNLERLLSRPARDD
ncbi:hypothetical protein OG589_18335 [Sphaerisporangium sp. NBC_01403]|uniref:hypothetical protein n=1 Tax=Sphaerisporangium sp. NBC_01403 TaxID=2903599 RepID=UPI0032514D61